MILKILSNNTLISEHNLIIDQEYLVGRSQECDIILDTKGGVSRKHLKLIINSDETLTVQLLSKLGELQYNNESVEELTIPPGEKFYVTNFEFLFENKVEEIEEVPLENFEEESKELPITEDNDPTNEMDFGNFEEPSAPEPTAELPAVDLNFANEEEQNEDDENTLTATNELSVILSVLSKSTGKVKKSYDLEGNNWIIGRDDKCGLTLPFPFISRKHFELVKTNEGFYIFDFGSANGTTVNGTKLPKKEHIRIYNDDIIQIKSLKLKIELKDKSYKDKVKHIEMDSEDNFQFNKPLNIEEFSNEEFFQPELKPEKKSNSKKSIMRALIALIIIAGGYFYMDKGKSNQRKVASVKKKSNKQSKKVDENQTLISDAFNVAKDYYTEKNHVMCISELERLHNLVPSYKNSKQLANLCQQGLEIQEEQKNRREREQQAKQAENRSNKIANTCRDSFPNFKSKVDLDNCLNQLVILNPGHPVILELQQKWTDIETQKQEELNNKLAYQKRLNAGETLIKRAQSQKSNGQLNSSIKSYNSFLSRSYPNKAKYKDLATREIASMQATLKNRMNELLSACENSFKGGNNKETVISCEKFLKKDGNLEESLGNIPAAKEKWNEILKFHVKSDEYYKKAKRKIKKYGDI